jgi:hypothetical protein
VNARFDGCWLVLGCWCVALYWRKIALVRRSRGNSKPETGERGGRSHFKKCFKSMG